MENCCGSSNLLSSSRPVFPRLHGHSFQPWRREGGGHSTKFYTGGLRPKVQTLTLYDKPSECGGPHDTKIKLTDWYLPNLFCKDAHARRHWWCNKQNWMQGWHNVKRANLLKWPIFPGPQED